MNKKSLVIIMSLVLSAVLLIVVLNMISNNKGRNQKNDFKRRFISHAILKLNERENKNALIRLCGSDERQLYFTSSNPDKIFVSDHNLNNWRILPLHQRDSIHALKYYLQIDYPYIFTIEFDPPAITVSNDASGYNRKYVLSQYFTKCVLISNSSVIYKGYDTSGSNLVFKKLNLEHATSFEEKGITERFNDGGFSTDGLLHFDKENAMVVYCYSYSSEYLGMDTNLNLLFRRHTIDNTQTKPIPVVSSPNKKSFSFSAPPRFISKLSCIGNGKLFVNSALKAQNDANDQFEHESVIDVYDLLHNTYTGSFYLPDINGLKIKNLKVVSDRLIVIYQNKIVTYRLTL